TAIVAETRAATAAVKPTSVMWLMPCSKIYEWQVQQPRTMRVNVQKARVRTASPKDAPARGACEGGWADPPARGAERCRTRLVEWPGMRKAIGIIKQAPTRSHRYAPRQP